MYCQERNGKYRFFESYLDPRTMKRKTLSVTMDKNTKQAKRDALKKLDLKASLMYSCPLPQMSFGDLCELYLKEKRGEVKKSVYREQSFISLSSSLGSLKSVIGETVQVSDLTPELILRQIAAEKGATVTTQNGRIKTARTIISFAAKKGLIDRDFSKSLEFIKKTESEKFDIDPSGRFLETDEVKRLIAAIDDVAEKDLTEFLILTGCRIGEALGLEEKNIDFKNDKLNIIQTYGAGTHKMGNPKRPASKRTIYMQPELKTLLKKVVKRNKETRERVFDKGTRVFIDANSALPIIYEHYYRHLGRYTLKADIDKHVTPHTLRRTHASILYANGIDKDQIARRLGHQPGSEDSITLAIYVYITKQREKAENKQLKKINFL